jgi:hypothetical protein
VASRRTRVRDARHRVLSDLVDRLYRDRSMSDADEITAIDALILEFRRRAAMPNDPWDLPGVEPLPGFEVMQP